MSHVITGQELKAQRRLRGMSQASLAELCGVNQKTVANWESSEVPEPREAQVREEVFFSDMAALLQAVPDADLAAEVLRRMTAAARKAAGEQWQGYSPPSRTRRNGDTPEVGA